jgi:hypothetical protein
MRILKFIAASIAAITLTTACNVKMEDLLKEPPVGQLWPAYAVNPLSGNVFGSPWTAVTAVARQAADPNTLALSIYAEPVSSMCQPTSVIKKPVATMMIPKAYAAQEYAMDTTRSMSGNPLVFQTPGISRREVTAQKTKLNIQTLTDSGFEGALYAQATETDGTISEINGRISVTDCTKVADFSVWDELVGNYRLVAFDGQPQNGRSSNIAFDTNNSFYDKATQQYVKTLIFPLYYNVSNGRSESYAVGPMRSLGISKLNIQGNTKTLGYSYHGPVTYDGTDIVLNLELRAVRVENRLDIVYTLEIPGKVPATSHQMVLEK